MSLKDQWDEQKIKGYVPGQRGKGGWLWKIIALIIIALIVGFIFAKSKFPFLN